MSAATIRCYETPPDEVRGRERAARVIAQLPERDREALFSLIQTAYAAGATGATLAAGRVAGDASGYLADVVEPLVNNAGVPVNRQAI